VPDFKLLVVCVGNVCRSPLAERLLRLRFDELLGARAGAVQVSSAGVLAMVGDPMDAMAAAQLRRLGGDPSGFAATQWTAARSRDADLVLTATRQLRSRVLEEVPRTLRRTFTVSELAALLRSDGMRDRPGTGAAELVSHAASWRGSARVDGDDIPDPIGEPEQVHREVADLIDRECGMVARAVADALMSGATRR